MDLLQGFTDDQIALMGCFVALVTSVALMYVSAFLNRYHRQTRIRRDAGHAHAVSLSARNDRAAQSTEAPSRKVA